MHDIKSITNHIVLQNIAIYHKLNILSHRFMEQLGRTLIVYHVCQKCIMVQCCPLLLGQCPALTQNTTFHSETGTILGIFFVIFVFENL